jgi:hypothetical protein
MLMACVMDWFGLAWSDPAKFVIQLQLNLFLVGKNDVITSVPSKELSAFLDSCSFLNLGQAVNFLFFVWFQYQIIFYLSKQSTRHIDGHFTHQLVAFLYETLRHLFNHLLGSHGAFSSSFFS